MDNVYTRYDQASSLVVIIGGGPAGMSCALWLKNYGYRPIIIEEKNALGGLQAQSLVSNTWLIGWQSKTGKEIAESFEHHIRYERIQTFLNSLVNSIERDIKGNWQVQILRRIPASERSEEIKICAKAVVIASGTLFVGEKWIAQTPGASDCRDRILIGPASYMDPSSWFGTAPIIVGGGDSALECACFLAARGSTPIIIARSDTLRAGESYRTGINVLVQEGRVDLRRGLTITTLSKASNGKIRVGVSDGSILETDTILLMLGYEPKVESVFVALGSIRPSTDELGFIRVGADCETDIPGLYAVGDVANPRHPCTATAIAMGTMAARDISKERDP